MKVSIKVLDCNTVGLGLILGRHTLWRGKLGFHQITVIKLYKLVLLTSLKKIQLPLKA